MFIPGHMKSVEVVVYSPDSKQLASGSWDRTAIIWNVEVLQTNLKIETTIHLSN